MAWYPASRISIRLEAIAHGLSNQFSSQENGRSRRVRSDCQHIDDIDLAQLIVPSFASVVPATDTTPRSSSVETLIGSLLLIMPCFLTSTTCAWLLLVRVVTALKIRVCLEICRNKGRRFERQAAKIPTAGSIMVQNAGSMMETIGID